MYEKWWNVCSEPSPAPGVWAWLHKLQFNWTDSPISVPSSERTFQRLMPLYQHNDSEMCKRHIAPDSAAFKKR